MKDSPYRGLSPYGESDEDARYFFGREREAELVAANLVASRLTILYGPSGVGKSSLLRAGVARRLRTLVSSGPADAPGPLVAVVGHWRDDPVAAIAAAAGASVGVPLGDALASLSEDTGGEVYLMLDQIEEYFLYHGRDGALADELEVLLERDDIRVHVLLGVRDDSLADLDTFKSRLSGLFANVLRLDHLNRAAGRAAIEGPLAERAAEGGPAIVAEAALIEAVLDEVAAGRIEQRFSGRGVVSDQTTARRVEAPYLQLVLERLWEAESAAGSNALRLDTLRGLGGAQRIVEQHLERALALMDSVEQGIASRSFGHLVTPSGSKIAHSEADLARYAEVGEQELASVLRTLAAQRILRPVPTREGGPPRYEIFHDVLGDAVLDWRQRYETDSKLADERERAHRRLRRLALVASSALLALAAVAAIAVYALAQRADARDHARAARARALTTATLLQLDRDPELALLLAREAERSASSPAADDALRRALVAFRTRKVRPLGSPPVAVGAVDGTIWAVGRDGLLYGDKAPVRLDDTAIAAAFDADMTTVVVGGPHGIVIRALATGRTRRVDAVKSGKLAVARNAFVVARPSGQIQFVRLPDVRVVEGSVPEQPQAVAIRRDGGAFAVGNGHVVRVFSALLTPIARIEDRTSILGVALSDDGTRAATAGADSAVRVWELPSGRLVNVMLGHRNLVKRVLFTPDGSRIVSASLDGSSRAWDADNGRLLGVLSRSAGVSAIAATPDGRFGLAGSEDGTVRQWALSGEPSLHVIARLPEPAGDLSIESTRIRARSGPTEYVVDRLSGAVSSMRAPPLVRAPFVFEGKSVRYRSSRGQMIVLRGHSNTVSSARYSKDRQLVVTASRDHDARVWDADTGRLVQVLRGHYAKVSDASFSPDGRWVVTAGPGTAGLFEVASGELVTYLRGHKGILTSAAFDPAGRVIVTAGADRTVRTYACALCGDGAELVALADRRLAGVRRRFTPAERRLYLETPG